MIEFMGRHLDNALIASSSIATENAANILRLAENGVQGAILKSCADYSRNKVNKKREFARDSKGHIYASSPFEKEILTLNECEAIMQELRPQTNILLIPSFTASSLNSEDWLPPCRKLADIGADGIQLDFFYMGNIIGEKNFPKKITILLNDLAFGLNIPVMPKLNINLPRNFIIPLIAESRVEYISLLDSIRSPYFERTSIGYKLSSRLDADTTSCFGNWQMPLTLSYTYSASQYGLKVCAGGGVTSHDDVQLLLAAGATTVQSATFLTKYPQKTYELIRP